MKLLMHILKENKKLNIDNRTISLAGILAKLEEEYKEVAVALLNYNSNRSIKNLIEVIRETWDLIQMCVLILWRCNLDSERKGQYNLIQEINLEHKDKLINRGWIIETGIEINVKE